MRERTGTRTLWESGRFVLTVFAVLTVVMTWPLAAHFTTHLPQGSRDLWQNLWSLWWWKKALVDLHQSPYFTDYLFFPGGTKLSFHTHSEINQIATLPVGLLLGPVAAYNAAILVGICLSGLGAYLLAREVSNDGRAALLAGLVFAFFPHHLEQTLEHLNLATVQFLPFVCLYLLRLLRHGGFHNALCLGFFFAANALGSWHYALFSLLFLPIIVLCERPSTGPGGAARRVRPAAGLALAAVTAVLLLAPFLRPIVAGLAAGQDYVKPFLNEGIDPLFLLLPSDNHPILGPLTAAYYGAYRPYTSVGFQGYVGLTPLALAVAAAPAIRRDRRLLAWAAIATAFLLLALGAHPRVAGRQLPVTLPHALFASLPLLDTLRVANRFVVVTMLALAVLSACGAARLFGSGERRWWFPAAAGLILFEYLWLPFPTQRVEFPRYLHVLAHHSAGAVLDIPFCAKAICSINQAFQTVHQRPIAGGYISAARADGLAAIQRDPVLAHAMGFEPRLASAADVEHLRVLGFGAVILHLDRAQEAIARRLAALGRDVSRYQRRGDAGVPSARLAAISAVLADAVGGPAYEDEQIRVFLLP